jgi:hypothetical protein
MERQQPLFANFRKYRQSTFASAKNAYQILFIEPRVPDSYIESDGQYYKNLSDAKKRENPITNRRVIRAIQLRKARMEQLDEKETERELREARRDL